MNKNPLIALTLTLTLTACSPTVVREYVKPECSPPHKPSLPYVDAQALYDAVGQDVYEDLLTSNRLRDNYANEMRAMIGVLCQPLGLAKDQ